jgi:hypothetical protein
MARDHRIRDRTGFKENNTVMRDVVPYDAWPVISSDEKGASYDPAQFRGLKATIHPMRSWGSGSYDRAGRSVNFAERGPGYGAPSGASHKVRLRDTGER